MHQLPVDTKHYLKTLFTWSGGPRSGGVGFFCFVSPRAWKQKKPTPLDRGPPLHVNRVWKDARREAFLIRLENMTFKAQFYC